MGLEALTMMLALFLFSKISYSSCFNVINRFTFVFSLVFNLKANISYFHVVIVRGQGYT